MGFFGQMTARFSEESPEFFKKLQRIAAWLVGLGTGLAGIPAALEEMGLAEVNVDLLVKISSYVVLVGIVLGSVAKMPVKEPEKVEGK